MKSLLLLDADIVIDLHKLGLWKAILSKYEIHLPSTVIGEVKHYLKGGERIPINLTPLLSSGELISVTVDLKDQQRVFLRLEEGKVDGVHEGELEALSYIYFHKDESIQIALKDHAAIRAAAFLGIMDKVMSVESMVKAAGVIRAKDNLPYDFSEKRFCKLKCEGVFLSVVAEKNQSKK